MVPVVLDRTSNYGRSRNTPPGHLRSAQFPDQPFTRQGQRLSDLSLPQASLPYDVFYLDSYAVVGCLQGPDRCRGAPIYILEGDGVVSTIMPKEELGLAQFRVLPCNLADPAAPASHV
jgi:hypothetical protein